MRPSTMSPPNNGSEGEAAQHCRAVSPLGHGARRPTMPSTASSAKSESAVRGAAPCKRSSTAKVRLSASAMRPKAELAFESVMPSASPRRRRALSE